MGRKLEFIVNIFLGYGDGGDIAVDMDVTDEEYELLKQCCRENEEIESFDGLKELYERIVVEARDESEFNDPEDCDIDYDEADYSVEIPFEIYEEVENEQTEEECMSDLKGSCTLCGRKDCAITIITDMDHVCGECLDNEFFYCDECNEYWRCDVVDSYELEDGRTVCEHCIEDIEAEEMIDEDEDRIEALLKSISENKNYQGRVYEAAGIYFIIRDGEIIEISSDAGYDPKGSWFPDVVSGLSGEEMENVDGLMAEAEGDILLFEELVENGVYDGDVEQYIKDKYDEDALEGYLRVEKAVESGDTPFDSMEELFFAVGRYELDSETLYYKWEGEYIDLYDNISECGQERGCFDSINDYEWIYILENIDDYVVESKNN